MLEVESDNIKALFRRASAWLEERGREAREEQRMAAMADIRNLLSFDPNNSQALKLLEEITTTSSAPLSPPTKKTTVPTASSSSVSPLSHSLSPAASKSSVAASSVEDGEWEREQVRDKALRALNQGNVAEAILSCTTAVSNPSLCPSSQSALPLLNVLLSAYSRSGDWRGVRDTATRILDADSSIFKARLKRIEANYSLVNN